jgi:hypothetical protein
MMPATPPRSRPANSLIVASRPLTSNSVRSACGALGSSWRSISIRTSMLASTSELIAGNQSRVNSGSGTLAASTRARKGARLRKRSAVRSWSWRTPTGRNDAAARRRPASANAASPAWRRWAIVWRWAGVAAAGLAITVFAVPRSTAQSAAAAR